MPVLWCNGVISPSFSWFGCDGAADWLLMEGGGASAAFAGLDLPIQNELSGPFLQHRRSLILFSSVVRTNLLWYHAVQCSTLLYSHSQFTTLNYCMLGFSEHYSVASYGVVLFVTVYYSAVQYSHL